ncbi:hypothetical protein VTN96DRAFT_9925 [Rasamsonia emersonii]
METPTGATPCNVSLGRLSKSPARRALHHMTLERTRFGRSHLRTMPCFRHRAAVSHRTNLINLRRRPSASYQPSGRVDVQSQAAVRRQQAPPARPSACQDPFFGTLSGSASGTPQSQSSMGLLQLLRRAAQANPAVRVAPHPLQLTLQSSEDRASRDSSLRLSLRASKRQSSSAWKIVWDTEKKKTESSCQLCYEKSCQSTCL